MISGCNIFLNGHKVTEKAFQKTRHKQGHKTTVNACVCTSAHEGAQINVETRTDKSTLRRGQTNQRWDEDTQINVETRTHKSTLRRGQTNQRWDEDTQINVERGQTSKRFECWHLHAAYDSIEKSRLVSYPCCVFLHEFWQDSDCSSFRERF